MFVTAKTLYEKEGNGIGKVNSLHSKDFMSIPEEESPSTPKKKRSFSEICPHAVREKCQLRLGYPRDAEFFVPPSLTMDISLDEEPFNKKIRTLRIALCGERHELFPLLCAQEIDRKCSRHCITIPLTGTDSEGFSYILAYLYQPETGTEETRIKEVIEHFKKTTGHVHVSASIIEEQNDMSFGSLDEHLLRAAVCQHTVQTLQRNGWWLQTGRTNMIASKRFQSKRHSISETLRYGTPILVQKSEKRETVPAVKCLRVASLAVNKGNVKVEIAQWIERWVWFDTNLQAR